MTTYTFNVTFTDAGLQLLQQAGEYVHIVKAVGSDSAGASLVWVSFKPFENNTITWVEQYGVYASNDMIVNGSKIHQVSQKDAQRDTILDFSTARTFNNAHSDPNKQGSYGVTNHEGTKPFTFGLTQIANVNGSEVTTQLNAATVPNGQTARFTPIITLSIGVHANMDNGAVITDLTSVPTTVRYDKSIVQSVAFDENNSTFILVN